MELLWIKNDDPNDGNGIGRVVREIKKDGSYGPIYFIYYNHGFNEKNTDYPYFKKSKDREFVKACQEISRQSVVYDAVGGRSRP